MKNNAIEIQLEKKDLIKQELTEIIEANSEFIKHIKDNLLKLSGKVHLNIQQGYSVEYSDNNNELDNFYSGKSKETFQEKRIYSDWIENSKENIPSIIRNEKLSLMAVRFAKRFDINLIKEICEEENFNKEVIFKSKEVNLSKFLQWVIKNTSGIKDLNNFKYNKDQEHSTLVISPKDLILIVNQQLMDEIRLKEILGEIKFVNYLKDLIIVDAPLPNNFQGVLISKSSLWCSYEIESIKQFLENETRFYLTISYEIGLFPFSRSCAFIKE